MKSIEVVDAWIDNVAYAHSKSESTANQYRRNMAKFCSFISKTPTQILGDYEKLRDREFRRKYAQYIRAFISKLSNNGYTSNSVKATVAAIKSFFKYNDLVLGYVPMPRSKVTFHNRDITKEEVVKILELSRPRDKAFFCMMAQSGLRPETLCNLRMKHIEPEFKKGIIPCKIDVPEEITKGQYRPYFSFMGEESTKYLRSYLATRANIGPEDYLFASHGTDKQLNSKSISGIFKRVIEQLKEKGLMDFEQKQVGKPRTVRLYNLRKFFRKFANQAGFEFVQFWMGHIVNKGQEEHYRPQDVEFHRKLYAEKAMPYLRLEKATRNQIGELIEERDAKIVELTQQLEQRNGTIKSLEGRVKKLEDSGMKELASNIETLFDLLGKKADEATLEKATDKIYDDLTHRLDARIDKMIKESKKAKET
jgi:integrase